MFHRTTETSKLSSAINSGKPSLSGTLGAIQASSPPSDTAPVCTPYERNHALETSYNVHTGETAALFSVPAHGKNRTTSMDDSTDGIRSVVFKDMHEARSVKKLVQNSFRYKDSLEDIKVYSYDVKMVEGQPLVSTTVANKYTREEIQQYVEGVYKQHKASNLQIIESSRVVTLLTNMYFIVDPYLTGKQRNECLSKVVNLLRGTRLSDAHYPFIVQAIKEIFPKIEEWAVDKNGTPKSFREKIITNLEVLSKMNETQLGNYYSNKKAVRSLIDVMKEHEEDLAQKATENAAKRAEDMATVKQSYRLLKNHKLASSERKAQYKICADILREMCTEANFNYVKQALHFEIEEALAEEYRRNEKSHHWGIGRDSRDSLQTTLFGVSAILSLFKIMETYEGPITENPTSVIA